MAAVRERLASTPGDLTPHRVAEALRAAGRPVGDATVLEVYEALRRDVVGAGPLEPLLRTPGVTDVLVNGHDDVYLDRGDGLERTEVTFADEDAVRRLAQRLAAHAGRRLDDATPYADLRLADGTRFHAVLAPVARPGTVISLRVPRPAGFTLDDLVETGLVAPELVGLLRRVVAATGPRDDASASRAIAVRRRRATMVRRTEPGASESARLPTRSRESAEQPDQCTMSWSTATSTSMTSGKPTREMERM